MSLTGLKTKGFFPCTEMPQLFSYLFSLLFFLTRLNFSLVGWVEVLKFRAFVGLDTVLFWLAVSILCGNFGLAIIRVGQVFVLWLDCSVSELKSSIFI